MGLRTVGFGNILDEIKRAYSHFIGVKPSGVEPKIYDVPYEEYLKTKDT